MLFLILTIALAVVFLISIIVGPRLDTSTIGFKLCVAVSALSLIATGVLGVYTYLNFNMGDPTQFEKHEVDDVFDLWLPEADKGPLVINSMQDEQGTWVYEIHTFDPTTKEEQMRYTPADLTNFLDPAEDGHCYMEWTESYVTLDGITYRDAATMDLAYRNEDEMEAAAAEMITKPNCVVYIPRGTVVNHPPAETAEAAPETAPEAVPEAAPEQEAPAE